MLSILTDNISTIAVAIVVAGTVAFIIRKLYRDRKQGKSTCGCNCSGCGGCSCDQK